MTRVLGYLIAALIGWFAVLSVMIITLGRGRSERRSDTATVFGAA